MKGIGSLFCQRLRFSKRFLAQVAQSVEQGTENPRVGSSILSLGTMLTLLPASLLALNSFHINPLPGCWLAAASYIAI